MFEKKFCDDLVRLDTLIYKTMVGFETMTQDFDYKENDLEKSKEALKLSEKVLAFAKERTLRINALNKLCHTIQINSTYSLMCP